MPPPPRRCAGRWTRSSSPAGSSSARASATRRRCCTSASGSGGPARTGTDVPAIDIAVDPLEGTNLVAHGQAGAITVLARVRGGRPHPRPRHVHGEALRRTGRGGQGRHPGDARPRTSGASPRRSAARSATSRSSSSSGRATTRSSPRSAPPAPGSSSSATATCRRPSRAPSRAPASTRSWASAARPRASSRRRRCAASAARSRPASATAATRSASAATRMGHGDEDRVYRTEDLAPGENLVFAATGVTAGDLLAGRPVLRRRRAHPLAGDGLPDEAGPLRRHRPHVRSRQPAARPALTGPSPAADGGAARSPAAPAPSPGILPALGRTLPGIIACVLIAAAARLLGTWAGVGLDTALALVLGLAVGAHPPLRALLRPGATSRRA